MKIKSLRKAWSAGILCLVLAACTAGCGTSGKENLTADQKEEKQTDTDSLEQAEESKDIDIGLADFSSGDGSFTVKMNQKWTTEDMGMDNFLLAGNALGTEAALVAQFPKSTYSSVVSSADDLLSVLEQSYTINDLEELEPLEIPKLQNVSTKKCRIKETGSVSEGSAYLSFGDTDYAYYALMYIAPKESDEAEMSFRMLCESFTENVSEEENNFSAEMTDTIRWINATYAVLTKLNGWNYNLFGGLPANDNSTAVMQEMLKQWWEVTDRAGADETMDWILKEGHRTGFAEDMEKLESDGMGAVPADERENYLLENYEGMEEQSGNYAKMYGYYEEFGPEAIDGWDYCRAISLTGYYYLAGFYTETEALDKALEIAAVIQTSFDSWDELMASYLRGYEYWAEESGEERQAVYEELKAAADSPYNLDWNTTLEKTW